APEMVDLRRRHLTARISDIESEYIPAVPAVEQPAPQPTHARQPEPQRTSQPPPVAPAPARRIESEPEIDRDDSAADRAGERHDFDYVDAPDDNYVKPPRRGRPWAGMLIGVLVLSAGVIGAWWAIDGGLFKTPAERDGSVPNPPQVLEDEEFDPDRPAEPPL